MQGRASPSAEEVGENGVEERQVQVGGGEQGGEETGLAAGVEGLEVGPEGEGAGVGEEEGQGQEGEQEDECSICFLPLLEEEVQNAREAEEVGVLSCGHPFHACCLDLWSGKCQEKGIASTCPLCRAPLIRGK